jgi:hypothetical protein
METPESPAQPSEFAPPPRPAKMLAHVIESSDNTAFRIRSKPGGVGVFLTLWLAGWSVACVAIIRQAITKQDWKMALLAVPFVGAWFLVAGLVLNLWRGCESLTVNREGLDHERGSLFGKKLRHITLAELRSIDVVTTTHSDDGSTYQRHRIEVATSGLPMTFGDDAMGMTKLSQAEADWLRHEIVMAMGMHGGQDVFDRLMGAPAQRSTIAAGTSSTMSAAPTLLPANLAGGTSTMGASSSSLRFRVIDAPDALIVERPHDWGFGKMFTVLFIALFWNSIVGVFIMQLIKGQPPGAMWWFVLVFLIPFELIGLLVIVGFIGEVLGPVRKRVWEISNDRLLRRSCVAIFSWTTRYDAAAIAAVRRQEITLGGMSKYAGKLGNNDTRAEALRALRQQGAYELVFLDAADKPVLTITQMTELEADAIERPLQQRVPRWYGN